MKLPKIIRLSSFLENPALDPSEDFANRVNRIKDEYEPYSVFALENCEDCSDEEIIARIRCMEKAEGNNNTCECVIVMPNGITFSRGAEQVDFDEKCIKQEIPKAKWDIGNDIGGEVVVGQMHEYVKKLSESTITIDEVAKIIASVLVLDPQRAQRLPENIRGHLAQTIKTGGSADPKSLCTAAAKFLNLQAVVAKDQHQSQMKNMLLHLTSSEQNV